MAAKVIQSSRLLSARRSYEFRLESLRLTSLAQGHFITRIKDLFQFQIVQIATPAPTFGPVTPSIPPGIVFNYGEYRADKSRPPVSIRLIHFETTRIVIDVAGSTNHIESIFEIIKHVADQIETLDGFQSIGDAFEMNDQSDFRVDLSFPFTSLLAPEVKMLYERFLIGTDSQILIPAVQFRVLPKSVVYSGQTEIDPTIAVLDLRASTVPEDRIAFSSAPLNSTRHQQLLEELNRIFE